MFPLKIIFLFITVWFDVQLKNMETNEILKLQDEYKQSSLKNMYTNVYSFWSNCIRSNDVT